MQTKHSVSRRTFVAGTSSLLLAGATSAAVPEKAQPAPTSELALHGGEKSIVEPPPPLARFGEPEREQLEAMLQQQSLFYWNGPQTSLLIERFKQFCPLQFVQTCSSGTAALHIAVAASGIGPGDEVITSPITDMGTVIGILYQQAVPVFADLCPSTYNLDVADVERRITAKTKAIIPVHLAGNPCDLAGLKNLADQHKLILIEDCAQAWGAQYRHEPIGSVGHFACFSLQDSKQVTCGDGGVVGSNNERFGPLLQKFGDKGYDRVNRTGQQVFATNYRMSEPQAAVAAAQLGRLEAIAATRSRLGRLLSEGLTNIPGLQPHEVHSDDRCVHYFYMFRVRPESFRCDRAEFVRALVHEGVGASGGYIPLPIYREQVFQQHGFFAGRWPIRECGLTNMDYSQVQCPQAEAILKTGIRISIHEAMTEEYIQSVAKAIHKVARYYAV